MQPSSSPPFDPKPLLRHLTHRPGVYRMLDSHGRVVYVGKARDLRRRVASYFSGRAHDAKTMAMLQTVADIEVTVTRTEAEALMLEYNLIKRHKPRFNVVLRDDKSYPYIHVGTDHEFPRLSFYRGSRRTPGRLFGPYPSAGSVRATLSQLQKLFRLRLCEDSYFSNRTRPCLQYQIERCTAPCVGLIDRDEYRRDVEHAMLFLQGNSEAVTERLADRMEEAASTLQFERAAQYRDQLAKLRQVQASQLMSSSTGDFDVVGLVTAGGVCCVSVMFFRGGRSLGSRNYFPRVAAGSGEDEIIRAFLLQYYGGREAPKEVLVSRDVPEAEMLMNMLSERAGRRVAIKWRLRGDRARWVDIALTNARHGAELKSRSTATIEAQLEALTDALGLDSVPQRLECFDVSHTQGNETVGSCVVFGAEGALKSDYRRFNVEGVEPGDDYAALEQVLRRRYAKVKAGEAPMPDLVIIDGGRGQLSSACEVLRDLGLHELAVIAVSKGEGRKPGRESIHLPARRQALGLPSDSPALHLIQQLRDEAHRFAITGHRARRQKRQTKSPLEQIRGLGPKRRRELLRQFGGLQAVSRAAIDDLTRVKGISRQLAESIYDRFHSE
jgi:excinuclease ABC subunit C